MHKAFFTTSEGAVAIADFAPNPNAVIMTTLYRGEGVVNDIAEKIEFTRDSVLEVICIAFDLEIIDDFFVDDEFIDKVITFGLLHRIANNVIKKTKDIKKQKQREEEEKERVWIADLTLKEKNFA